VSLACHLCHTLYQAIGQVAEAHHSKMPAIQGIENGMELSGSASHVYGVIRQCGKKREGPGEFPPVLLWGKPTINHGHSPSFDACGLS
jgi:hypothetical protein